MTLETYAAYLLVLVVAVIVPGPTNTLIVANSMRHGVRAGLLNVAGTQIAVAIMLAIVGIGLTSFIAAVGHWFEWLKLVGAAYLMWIGWKMLRAGISGGETGRPVPPRRGFLMQGLVVSLGNPKQLLFIGALLPQFIDPHSSQVLQIAILGASALAVGTLSDSFYALAAGRIARGLTARRERLVSGIGGSFLIGGGLLLAVSRS